nr:MAG TPA: hypothetical protein [Bacteriophage sp.]
MGLVAKWDRKEIVSVRRSCGFEIRRQKRLPRFTAEQPC